MSNIPDYGNPVPRQADVFDELRTAQIRFADACQKFQYAAAERAASDKNLQDISEKAVQAMKMALQDPTTPQCAENICPPKSGNGQIGPGGASRW